MPTKRIYVDFESRSQADIWTTGAYRYAEDPTTEILCLAWAIDDGPIEGALRGVQLMDAIVDLNKLIEEGAEFHAHNAYFERCMWKFQLSKYGALPIPIKQWRCTAAKSMAHAMPRALEKVALALSVPHKKDMEGSRLMRAISKSTGHIPREKLERLLEYCKADVATERDIDKRLSDLSQAEQRVWFMDQYINDTGVTIDVDAVKKAIDIIKVEKENLNKELYNLTGGEVNAGTQRDAIKKYLEKKGVKLPDLQKATVKKAILETGGDNLRILQLRQQLSLTSNAKYQALLDAVSADGRVRDLLVYHGASTGRWSGKLVQIQNLVKAFIKPDEIIKAVHLLKGSPDGFALCYEVLPTLSSCIRAMFIPTPGYKMYTSDFAAIEARVVMWLAGEPKVKLFETEDIYVHMAKLISSSATRQLGKQTVLGCGFGMSFIKFQETCEKYGVDIGEKTKSVTRWVKGKEETVMVSPLAITAVNSYRKTFAKVPRFWYAMEDAAKKAVLSGKPYTCGKIRWYMSGEFLRMELPSGRTIVYHRPKISPDGKFTFYAENSTTRKYEVEEAWGGKLVENATQAVARDIMVSAMFGLMKAGYRILFTVHDELVVEHKEGSCKEIIDIVRNVPTWARGCPINAECDQIERYKK